MSSPFQVSSLVNPPSFPNSIVWSEDNLLAVATSDIVTILNPEQPYGLRGVITLTAGKPFPVGIIDRADLLSGCLLSTCLSRDRQPCVRSLSWSLAGFAPNNGCLLAVCSTEGHVKVYRQPYCEYQAEWIEVMDLSHMLLGYFAKINYGEPEVSPPAVVDLVKSAKNILLLPTRQTSLQDRNTKGKERMWSMLWLKQYVFPAPLCKRVHQRSLHIIFVEDFTCVTQLLTNLHCLHADLEFIGFQCRWRTAYIAGGVQCFEGSMVLGHFCDTETSRREQWFEINSRINSSNQANNPDIATADGGYSFPKIRPSMDVARLPEHILFAKSNEVGEILKAGQVLKAWTTNRWHEGVFVGFSDGGLLGMLCH